MGIVVDLQRSEINFKDPVIMPDPMDVIHNQLVLEMHSFEAKFGIAFDPDPKVGVGGAPPDEETWRIGIIQNVVYEKSHYEYEGRKPFDVEFKDAVVDVDDKGTHFPFVGDPDFKPPVERPVWDICYTSQGYGELLNPSTGGLATTNKPDTFNSSDQPNLVTKLRISKGSIIKRAEKLTSFQLWLVARSPKATHVLANIPPFTLVYWLETTSALKTDLSTETPSFKYEFYGENGIVKKVRTSGSGTPSIRASLGVGVKSPVMTGIRANKRIRDWANSNGL